MKSGKTTKTKVLQWVVAIAIMFALALVFSFVVHLFTGRPILSGAIGTGLSYLVMARAS